MDNYQVIVIGGGHAGVEAAAASARMGARTLLLSISKDNLGEMSCNPSIGGLGKGQLVREIDALDGIMGRAVDISGTQFRILNASKGEAVQGLRAQVDRQRYKIAIQDLLKSMDHLTIQEGEVAEILIDKNKVSGVKLTSDETILAPSIIITTGTFLNGVMHTGDIQTSGGRINEPSSKGITKSLIKNGFRIIRLKTGTPPRFLKSSINYDGLEVQKSDPIPTSFSYLYTEISTPQLDCHITYTNEHTHDIILKDKNIIPLYNGQIKGIGPRYCPSIEDKVVRFSHHLSHHIFLEPEGIDSPLIYPNGISTSLPKEVQDKFIRTIKGLEKVEITTYGYAIEYDAIDAIELKMTLESKRIEGLFFAGQINGTSGYEEAAAQGIIAGINSALFVVKRPAFTLDRSDAYIGVLINDITTLGVDEPYRMFTSRSEYRLSLRGDNADTRLTPLGIKIGVIGETRKKAITNKQTQMEKLKLDLTSQKFNKAMLSEINLNVPTLAGVSFYDSLKYNNVNMDILKKLFPKIQKYDEAVLKQTEIEGRYKGYLKRQIYDIENYKRDQLLKIPPTLDYNKVSGLTIEVLGKLIKVRPETLAQASRIPGITPASLTALLKYIKK